MKIGVISDSHDNIVAVRKVFSILLKENVDVVLHSGDFSAPFMIDVFASFNVPVHLVFGNIDDRYLTTKKVFEVDDSNNRRFNNVFLQGNFLDLSFDNKSFFMNHFPKFSELAFKTGNYDFSIFGHTHKRFLEFGVFKGKEVVLLNPGELLGRFGDKSFVIVDTSKSIRESVKFFSFN